MPQNNDNEQLDYLGNVVIAQDQPLRGNALLNAVVDRLGNDSCRIERIYDKRVVVYTQNGRDIVLLVKAITYLGNPHPLFKKRIQLPDWYQDFCAAAERDGRNFDIRFLGVYHYGDNTVFVDFKKDTYLAHGMHNSSAHVYVNDLFQAQTYGIFEKEDQYGNIIVSIRCNKLKDYLDGQRQIDTANLFDLFRQFNCGFSFGQWLNALEVIQEMYHDGWRQWKQAEWAGWFLEYRFNKFTIENEVTDRMRYISQKKDGELDFDIRFEEADFYGDLKASDIKHSDAPGNDQESLIECIYRYGRFWYVIYEHETIKDSDRNYVATVARNQFIRSVDPDYEKDDMSYHQKMKNSVRFMKMTILELNKVNFRDALKAFNQGHQPNGGARKPKFLIDKKTLQNDNYAVFRYTYR
jgi:hypothetical protein